jgi:hypothetical protein
VLEAPPLLHELERVTRRQMLAALPVDPAGTLRDTDFRTLHSIYATWRGRVPSAQPKRVHLSAELLANPERCAYGDGLAAVLREIAMGTDLRPRTSTAVEHAYALEPPPVLTRRRSGRQHDRLLADWEIHHLHLSTDRHHRRPEFVKRSGHVLFAAFVGGDAYLIDLRPHERDGANWSELAILETVVRNWPDAGILQASDFAIGLVGGNWSDEDRRELREAGISGGMVEIDDRVWSAGGQSVGGTPLNVAKHCMATNWFLSGYSPTADELGEELHAMAAEHGLPDGGWRAHVDGDDYGFVNGHLFVRFGSLLP